MNFLQEFLKKRRQLLWKGLKKKSGDSRNGEGEEGVDKESFWFYLDSIFFYLNYHLEQVNNLSSPTQYCNLSIAQRWSVLQFPPPPSVFNLFFYTCVQQNISTLDIIPFCSSF